MSPSFRGDGDQPRVVLAVRWSDEWCIDAPTLHKITDEKGNEIGIVTAPSESGDLYQVQLLSNPVIETDISVGGPQNAAYVPTVSIGGPAYTINHGQVIGVGN